LDDDEEEEEEEEEKWPVATKLISNIQLSFMLS